MMDVKVKEEEEEEEGEEGDDQMLLFGLELQSQMLGVMVWVCARINSVEAGE
jgi:hypothetical protein